MEAYLHTFDAKHIDEDCTKLTGRHNNELFFNCKFDVLNGLTLEGCDLNRSEFITSKVRDALGFTLTMDCHSFNKVKWSPLLFDLMLCLLVSTEGNDEKRKKLIDVLGESRYQALSRVLALEE